MEETIKMKSKNSDGIEIIKDVPKSLYSNYLAIGWEVIKEKPVKPILSNVVSNKTRLDKNNDEDSSIDENI